MKITQQLNTENETKTLSPAEKISIDLIKFDQPITSLSKDTIVDESYKNQNDTVDPTLKRQASLKISSVYTTSPTKKILTNPLSQQASKQPPPKKNLI